MKEVSLVWSEVLPTAEGYYVRKIHGQWPMYLACIKQGNWMLAQNPEWMYVNTDTPLHSAEKSVWFGPIPEPFVVGFIPEEKAEGGK